MTATEFITTVYHLHSKGNYRLDAGADELMGVVEEIEYLRRQIARLTAENKKGHEESPINPVAQSRPATQTGPAFPRPDLSPTPTADASTK